MYRARLDVHPAVTIDHRRGTDTARIRLRIGDADYWLTTTEAHNLAEHLHDAAYALADH